MGLLTWTNDLSGQQAIGESGTVFHLGWKECGCCGVLSIDGFPSFFGTWSEGEFKEFAEAHEQDAMDDRKQPKETA